MLIVFHYFTRYDSGKVDITDLTWEQKERILRYLFARMNGGSSEEKKKMSSAPTLPAIEQGKHRNMTQSQDDLQYVWFYTTYKVIWYCHCGMALNIFLFFL